MPETAQVVIALAVAAAIGMVFLGPVTTAVNENSGTTTVTNESVTADVGSYVELGAYSVIDGTETVYNASGAEQTAGTDYELAAENSSIKALSGGSIADGETIAVAYDYQASGELATTVMEFIPMMLGLLIFVGIARHVQKEMN